MFTERRVTDNGVQWCDPESDRVRNVYSTVLRDSALNSMGLVAYWAAWLETHIEDAIIQLLDGYSDYLSYQRGKMMTRDMSANQMISKVRALIGLSVSPEPEALVALEGAANALRNRNRILHGAMGGHLTEGMASLGNRRSSETTEVSERDILDAAEALFDASMHIFSIRWDRVFCLVEES